MAKNFTSTLEKMFILNPSFFFNGMWSIVKCNHLLIYHFQSIFYLEFIHPETAAKIHVLKKKDFSII